MHARDQGEQTHVTDPTLQPLQLRTFHHECACGCARIPSPIRGQLRHTSRCLRTCFLPPPWCAFMCLWATHIYSCVFFSLLRRLTCALGRRGGPAAPRIFRPLHTWRLAWTPGQTAWLHWATSCQTYRCFVCLSPLCPPSGLRLC